MKYLVAVISHAWFVLMISVCIMHTGARAETLTVVDESLGTICSEDYIQDRFDFPDGRVEVESRTYMDDGLRWFETTVENKLSASYAVQGAYLMGYGISTNKSEEMKWISFTVYGFISFGGARISNDCSETFLYAAEDSQQEVWKIFTNSVRSQLVVKMFDNSLVTGLYIRTLGPTQEPEPGMLCLSVIGVIGLVRVFRRSI